MFSRSSNFDKLLDKATSNLRLEPDWPAILQICDLIRQGDVTPKYALAAIKKKLNNSNPHVSMFALQVLESCVKNCGNLIHDEIGTKAYMEELREFVKTTPHDNVKNKVLELIQAWAFAFRNSPKYRAVQDTMNIMKAEDYKFPVLKESDAMFSADTAPEWADGDCCHRCRVQFGLVQRKHHCRACGQVFCAQCSSKTCTLPKFGIEKEVRVCEACYNKLSKPAAASKAASEDLPVEYLTSSLAQQNQAPPPRKSEDELREEEELQLALALSQSEAEHKDKKTSRTTTRARAYSPPPSSCSPPSDEVDPELARYLNRYYWENRQQNEDNSSPSAPANVASPMPATVTGAITKQNSEAEQNGVASDSEMEEFVHALKSQVEIFVNRMKSNSSRGRSIANDSSVQTLFMNITSMHSRLLRYIQLQDDTRVYYEGLQDKLVQVKDARAALDALREEHREKLRREAEMAERQRQLQMAQKLDIMRKKKQEYLQYQRQLALQRIQEQEREMQMRQEQQKQQYLMGSYNSLGYLPQAGAGYDSSTTGGVMVMPPSTTYQPNYPPYHPQGMRGQPMPGGPMMMPSHPGAYMPGPMGPPGQMMSGPMMHTPGNIGQQQMMPTPNQRVVGPVGPQMMGMPGSATLPRTGPQNQVQVPPGQLPQGPPGQLPQGPAGQIPQGPQNQIQGPPGSQTQMQVPSQGQQIQGPPISQGMPVPQGPQMSQIPQQVGPQGPMVPGAPMSPTSSQMNIAAPAQSQSMTTMPMQMPMMMAHPMPQQFAPPQGALQQQQSQPPAPAPAPPQEEQTAELISFD